MIQTKVTGWQAFRQSLVREWQPREHSLVKRPELLFNPLGWTVDPWQLSILRRHEPQTLVLCPRQVGKSLTAGAKALLTAYTKAGSLSVIISRSQNQAAEVLLKVKIIHSAYTNQMRESRRIIWQPKHLKSDDVDPDIDQILDQLRDDPAIAISNNQLSLEFDNGSRIVTMACKSETTVGSTTDLLILDEAARMPDQVYLALRPTLAIAQSAGRGELLALSTPNGKRGWFYDAWKRCEGDKKQGERPEWAQVSIRVEECPRITPAFLALELKEMGRRWYEQEYECQFRDAIDSVFRSDDIERVFSRTIVRPGLPEAVEI